MTDSPHQPFLRINTTGANSFSSLHEFVNDSDLGSIWKILTKVKDQCEEGGRLENIFWRVWHLRKQKSDVPEDDFKKLTSSLGHDLQTKASISNMDEVKNHPLTRQFTPVPKQIACSNCKTNVTPLWRKSKDGTMLCNACGLYLKLHGDQRPLSLKTDVIKKRQRTPSTTSKKAQKKNNNLPRSASSSMLSSMNPPPQAIFGQQMSSNPTSPANALPSINEMDVQSILTHPDMFNTNLYQRQDNKPTEYFPMQQGQYNNVFQQQQPPPPQVQPFMMRPNIQQQPIQQPASPTNADYYSSMYWNQQ